MDKLSMKSSDPTKEKIELLKQLFPGCIKETNGAEGVVECLDIDALKQELSNQVVEGQQERYQFTWPGKRGAIALANSTISATLRPCKEESVNFDETKNAYIEGDNLDVLKLLRETYLGKIKMIYIDPPYNTGSDFVYNDDFAQDAEEYAEVSGQYDDQGKRLVQNTESNGRFHTDWLNMIYPRIKIARDLLTEDGLIFISLDDNEIVNMRKICDEVFSINNFVGQITVVGNPRGRDYGGVARMHDYLLVYKKSEIATINLIKDEGAEFKMFDELGGFELRELRNRNIKFNKENRPNLYYPFYINPEKKMNTGYMKLLWSEKRDGLNFILWNLRESIRFGDGVNKNRLLI